jgi:hypothetical protein
VDHAHQNSEKMCLDEEVIRFVKFIISFPVFKSSRSILFLKGWNSCYFSIIISYMSVNELTNVTSHCVYIPNFVSVWIETAPSTETQRLLWVITWHCMELAFSLLGLLVSVGQMA